MFAVIHIPSFSLQSVLRHETELRSRAVALVDPELPKPVIVELTSAARRSGVIEGLTAGQAMARCGELIIKTRSLVSEEAATEVLLQTAYAFSPAIEDTALGVCTMELRGLGLASEAARHDWSRKVLGVLGQLNLEGGMGFGITPELALLAARFTVINRGGGEHDEPRRAESGTEDSALQTFRVREDRPFFAAASGVRWLQHRFGTELVHGKDEDGFLATLPISVLEPSPEIADVLRRWGIRTIGEFLALGKNEVAERLGAAALELFERVSTESVRPLKLVSPPENFSEQIEFENEIETAEPLLFVLRRFIEQLSCRLEMIYLVVAELQLELSLSSGAKYERVFKIPSPTGRIETLFRTLQTHLDTLRTDAPIISLRLAAKPSQPESHQFGLFETTLRDPNQFAETLARLTALCGSERVGTPQLLATNKPDSFRMAVPEFGSSPIQNPKSEIQNSGLILRRFRPVRPAYLEFRNEQPALIRSEVFNGAVAVSRGPFRSSGNWWDAGIWVREEWDVETSDGLLLRVFRSSDGCFVEGVYD